ncbi:MAG: hypothetical protein CMF62_12580 [Magnetococcales bacterium]|nr:hypothetical protein [Magnetococcales bacterium]|tara:strand:+ start:143514 stop:144071 length:558 start_codon:yes stop_codon:yes gene_type:complete
MNDAPHINWQFLSQALAYYQNQGYTYVEAPWTVRRETTEVTFPQAYEAMGHDNGLDNDLVGSAEQSFIQLALDGDLPKGRYVALTPCFRQEPAISATHRAYFMKVELFDSLTPTDDQLQKTIKTAFNWFKQHTTGKLEIVQTDLGYDINLNDIEVGSYMKQKHGDFEWLCATGHAEPRFSVANTK